MQKGTYRMPSKRMVTSTVTLFNSPGENTGGSRVYHKTILTSVYCVETKGVQGDTPIDRMSLSIFDLHVIGVDSAGNVKPYMDPDDWKALPDKSKAWTLQANKSDYVVPGITFSERPTLCPSFYRILTVKRCMAGTKRMWKWRVEAK